MSQWKVFKAISIIFFLVIQSTAQEPPQLMLPIGHAEVIDAIALSPDGGFVVSGAQDNTLKLWEIATGREVRTLRGHDDVVFGVAFSPDGKYIISGSDDRKLKLWDVSTGNEIRTFHGHKDMILSVAYSPDGRYIASSSVGTIKLWEVATGREIRTLTEHNGNVYQVTFSPDGRYLLSGGQDGVVLLWDVSTGVRIRVFRGQQSVVLSVAFSPDGGHIAAGYFDKKIWIWDVMTGQKVHILGGHDDFVKSVNFSSDSRRLVSGSYDKTIKLWDVNTGKLIRNFVGHTNRVVSAIFSSDGRYIVSGSWDRTLRLWDVTTGKTIRVFSGHTQGQVYRVAFSPDGHHAISVFLTGKIFKLWNVKTGREVHTFKGHKDSVEAVDFSPDGRYIISGSADGTLKLWDVATGKGIRTFTGHNALVAGVAFSPDGRTVVSGSMDNTMKIWEIETEKKRSIKFKEWPLVGGFSPDGRFIVVITDVIEIREAKKGKKIRTLEGNPEDLKSPRFSPDGRYIAAVSWKSNMVKLWDVVSGKVVRIFAGHTDRIVSVSFSPDGRYLVSGSWDKTLKLWDVATGENLRTFLGHQDCVYSTSFSPDGSFVISGSRDHSVKVWKVESGKLLLTRLHVGQRDWVGVTPDGRFDGSKSGIELLYYAQNNRIIPLYALFERFFTPGLVAQILSGEITQSPEVDIRKGMGIPPMVTITEPSMGQIFESEEIAVTIRAEDQGGGIEDIRLYHNDKLVGMEERGLKVQGHQGAQTRTFKVSLLSGENILRTTAFSQDRTEAKPYEVQITLKAAEATATLYVLSVGINEYKNSVYNLNYARIDAESVAEILRQRGQGIFKDVEVTVLKDRQATRQGFLESLKAIQDRARPEDVFVLFYAGHGVMSTGTPDHASDFYLVMSDATSIYGNDDLLTKEGLSATELRDLCTGIAARKQLVMMDACQAGGAVEGFAMRGAAEEKAILQLARSAGVVIISAAGTEQFAAEVDEIGHGVFTFAVLQALEGSADGGGMVDGKITVKELEAYLNDRIPELTKKYRGSAQYPNSYSRGQDFPVTVIK
jgi:WD40 repeat protein